MVDNGLDGHMGLVGGAGERILEKEARLSREVTAHSLYQSLSKTPAVRLGASADRAAWSVGGFGVGRLLESLGRVSATWL
jgi:hypothetical protein